MGVGGSARDRVFVHRPFPTPAKPGDGCRHSLFLSLALLAYLLTGCVRRTGFPPLRRKDLRPDSPGWDGQDRADPIANLLREAGLQAVAGSRVCEANLGGQLRHGVALQPESLYEI